MKTFLPSIKNGESVVSEGVSDENKLFLIIKNSPHQERTKFEWNNLLSLAAAIKAQDMALRDYFSHTSPDGVTANENVRAVGYVLPDFYPTKGNNVESIAISATPESAADAWYNSLHHRYHVYGHLDFYKNQECIGVGIATNQEGNKTYYVFISAPCS